MPFSRLHSNEKNSPSNLFLYLQPSIPVSILVNLFWILPIATCIVVTGELTHVWYSCNMMSQLLNVVVRPMKATVPNAYLTTYSPVSLFSGRVPPGIFYISAPRALSFTQYLTRICLAEVHYLILVKHFFKLLKE